MFLMCMGDIVLLNICSTGCVCGRGAGIHKRKASAIYHNHQVGTIIPTVN